ncbi:Capsule polysaccharide biosynthesis protein [Rhodobacteraceae bacterium THAF1]|uniref:capsule biosynthesis protein n=1 Tax=Palleronia sp. THAF1 TaxID=2587842 RepID=UPI000F3D6F0A|nr:capsular biosynthesis protein [Palleronia sp. THAF1]QFU08681.1 Capsule polysaccharide biosynthesis protein [Palleronia sp. THAF1]VDC28428.1 Capsule polysaccharide biosynthesis protein [Rhodobacteraceae bacterium THAF1]
MAQPDTRSFLFLQGPHGPFFGQLGRMVSAAGGQVWRVGFNRGDQAFWPDKTSYIPYNGSPEDWPDTVAGLLDDKAITDIVLYGDTRPIHAQAVGIAKARGLRVHVFEEGYLRPYWVTYERDGSNGNSALMDTDLAQMQTALDRSETETPEAPAHWGDMRQHVFYGAAYHTFVLLMNGRYANFRPHRAQTVRDEFQLYLRKLLLAPAIWAQRKIATWRVKTGGFPYHLALLQLEHDSNFQQHSPFTTGTDFLRTVLEGFAHGAPAHHHLVFKAHPLEDGRIDQRRTIRRIASELGVAKRVHYVRGGKLAQLLDHARSAVTVNSTAAQQVLWRGLPLKVFGDAVYAKPQFVSTQPLAEFFETPSRPDGRAYRDYRRYLLETSQIPGSFYSSAGRRQLLRQVVDMMLAPHDPYEALARGQAQPRQKLRVVK